MIDAEVPDPGIDPVELVLGDEEGVVLCLDLDVGRGELDVGAVAEIDDRERSPGRGIGTVQYTLPS